MTGKPRTERASYEGKRAINQHMYRHHEHTLGKGTLEDRLQLHDDMHWQAKRNGEDLGHQHLAYQDGESTNEMAQRLLAEGTEQHVRE